MLLIPMQLERNVWSMSSEATDVAFTSSCLYSISSAILSYLVVLGFLLIKETYLTKNQKGGELLRYLKTRRMNVEVNYTRTYMRYHVLVTEPLSRLH